MFHNQQQMRWQSFSTRANERLCRVFCINRDIIDDIKHRKLVIQGAHAEFLRGVINLTFDPSVDARGAYTHNNEMLAAIARTIKMSGYSPLGERAYFESLYNKLREAVLSFYDFWLIEGIPFITVDEYWAALKRAEYYFRKIYDADIMTAFIMAKMREESDAAEALENERRYNEEYRGGEEAQAGEAWH